MMPLEEIGP